MPDKDGNITIHDVQVACGHICGGCESKDQSLRAASSYAREAEAVEKVLEAAKEVDMRIVHTNEVEQALREALAGLERARRGG